ncbi:MAG TPA: hypothetical protein VFY41_04890 [Nitrososphaeraceae archaeon]|nr:hypothetical protein [Nitrososphaeraceae archaeon]
MSEKKIPYVKDALVSISDAIQISEACYNIRDERKVEFSHIPDKTVIISN